MSPAAILGAFIVGGCLYAVTRDLVRRRQQARREEQWRETGWWDVAKTKTAPVTRDNWHSWQNSSTRFDFFRKEVGVLTDWGIEEFSICVQCAALVRQMDEFTHYEWHAREASRG